MRSKQRSLQRRSGHESTTSGMCIYRASEDGYPPTAVGADGLKEGNNSRYACDSKLPLTFLALSTTARSDVLECSMLRELLDVLE
jgi:hypothetical protein